jgi:hypothetical protein
MKMSQSICIIPLKNGIKNPSKAMFFENIGRAEEVLSKQDGEYFITMSPKKAVMFAIDVSGFVMCRWFDTFAKAKVSALTELGVPVVDNEPYEGFLPNEATGKGVWIYSELIEDLRWFHEVIMDEQEVQVPSIGTRLYRGTPSDGVVVCKKVSELFAGPVNNVYHIETKMLTHPMDVSKKYDVLFKGLDKTTTKSQVYDVLAKYGAKKELLLGKYFDKSRSMVGLGALVNFEGVSDKVSFVEKLNKEGLNINGVNVVACVNR